ncbi:MAG: MMPL family transporter [Pirellulales bacterium]|nr:MMPL family transporter [Pirellulales bacterium]
MDGSFLSRYSLWILAVAVFLLPFAAIGSIRAKQANKNDVRNWIPQQYEETQVYAEFRKQFTGEEFLLVSWEGCTRKSPRLRDLELKLLPPMEILYRGESEPQRIEDFDEAKLAIAARQQRDHAQTAAANSPDSPASEPLPLLTFTPWVAQVPPEYQTQLQELARTVPPEQLLAAAATAGIPIREYAYVFALAEDVGDPSQPNTELALATIVRDQARYFKHVLSGPRALGQLLARNVGLDEETAAAKLTGLLFGPRHKTSGNRFVHKYSPDGEPLDPESLRPLEEGDYQEIPLDERQTCVVVTLSEKGLLDKKGALEELRRIAIEDCCIPEQALHIGGPPADNVTIDEAGNKSLNTLAGLAVGIGFIVSWFSLRSWKLVLIVISAGIYSSILSLSLVWWTGAPVDAILFTMPSLVYVATTSGAIHLSNYYRDLLLEGHPRAGAGTAALKHAALPLALATGTTAVGLATLCLTELVPIYYFGLYSAIGVVVSGLLLVFYIPALLELWQPDVARPTPAPLPVTATHTHLREDGFFWRAGQWILTHHGIAAATCLLVMGVVGYGMVYAQTSVQLMRLLSPRERLLADYRWLEERLGPLVPMEVVLRLPKPTDEETADLRFYDRLELVDCIRASIEEIPEVGSTITTLTFMQNLEDLPTPRFGGTEFKESFLNKLLLKHRPELLTGDFLRDVPAPDNPGAQEEIWRISARVSALKNVDYARFITDLKSHVEPVVSGYLIGKQEDEVASLMEKLERADSGEIAELQSRLAAAQARLRTSELNEALATTLPAWADNRSLRAGVYVQYTGVVPLVYKAQHSLVGGMLFGFVTDFALIVIVMMLVCRDWSAGMVLLLPSAFPAVLVFGGMGWMHAILSGNGWGNMFIDIGFVLAPAVALGVTVDDVVHFMLWFRKGTLEGMNRKEATELAYRGCARAMYQSWGVIGIGLAAFSLSPFMPTRNFGLMMVSMLTVALVGNLVLLPAILAGPGGAIFAWGILRKANRRPARHADAEMTNNPSEETIFLPVAEAIPGPGISDPAPEVDLPLFFPLGTDYHDQHSSAEPHITGPSISEPHIMPLPFSSNHSRDDAQPTIPLPHLQSERLRRALEKR